MALFNLVILGLLFNVEGASALILAAWMAQAFGLALYRLLAGPHEQTDHEQSSKSLTCLKSHEVAHEHKRHVQVALSLIELGRKEEALAYIDSITNDFTGGRSVGNPTFR